MKSLERYEGLWRDNIPKQCIYAAILGVLVTGSIQIGIIAPKEARIERLMREAKGLREPLMVQQNHVALESHMQTTCTWDKNEMGWHMQGDFASVYECVMSEENARAVALMRLQKHVMGVSVMLGFNEMPT